MPRRDLGRLPRSESQDGVAPDCQIMAHPRCRPLTPTPTRSTPSHSTPSHSTPSHSTPSHSVSGRSTPRGTPRCQAGPLPAEPLGVRPVHTAGFQVSARPGTDWSRFIGAVVAAAAALRLPCPSTNGKTKRHARSSNCRRARDVVVATASKRPGRDDGWQRARDVMVVTLGSGGDRCRPPLIRRVGSSLSCLAPVGARTGPSCHA